MALHESAQIVAIFRRSSVGIGVAVKSAWHETHSPRRFDMKQWIALPIAAVLLVKADRAYAQETTPGPGVLEATIIPAGVGCVTSKNGGPSFGNYGLGTALTYNINRFIGIEG